MAEATREARKRRTNRAEAAQNPTQPGTPGAQLAAGNPGRAQGAGGVGRDVRQTVSGETGTPEVAPLHAEMGRRNPYAVWDGSTNPKNWRPNWERTWQAGSTRYWD